MLKKEENKSKEVVCSSSTWLIIFVSPAQFGFLVQFLFLRPALHDDPRLGHRLVDGFVRQDVGAVQVELVVHDHVLAQHRHVLHPHLRTQRDQVFSPPPAPPWTLTHVLLTHWPTDELQPTMQLSNQEWDRTLEPFSTVQRFIRTPSSTTTPAPMVTFGPMVQFFPICAVGSCGGESGTNSLTSGSFFISIFYYREHQEAALTTRTLPRKPGPVCSLSGACCRSDWRYKHIPVRKSLGWPMSIQKPTNKKWTIKDVGYHGNGHVSPDNLLRVNYRRDVFI